MSIRRISAIFEKDIKDLMKNAELLVMLTAPILFSLILNRSIHGKITITILYMIIGGIFTLVTSGTIMTMMAEEKEKKTLRGLIQSPASLLDIIIGKSLVTLIGTLITLTVSLLLVGIEPVMNFRAIIGLILLLLFFLLIGISMGLFANSLASVSVYLIPMTFLFGFTPQISTVGALDKGSIAVTIIDKFPIVQAMETHKTSSWLPLGILAIWVIGAAIITYVCFRKAMTDN
ncbi:ABC transporter permease [Paenibacillus sonchi]|uniref:ABC transporter permease n=1 Tax=Paenibacillus sonchi TaxID=373687 RepID=A0A974S9P0_9BACL|nr:ABC transporter permease [Paenibacillus sonchi]QQZ58693.1 ABC transporter permease [Paenibacillus sonchi]